MKKISFPELSVRKLPHIILNKYVVALLCFLLWMMFFDKHKFLTQMALTKTVNELKEDKERYNEMIEQAKLDLEEFENNKEQLAREKFFMHKENEQIFIVNESMLKEEK